MARRKNRKKKVIKRKKLKGGGKFKKSPLDKFLTSKKPTLDKVIIAAQAMKKMKKLGLFDGLDKVGKQLKRRMFPFGFW